MNGQDYQEYSQKYYIHAYPGIIHSAPGSQDKRNTFQQNERTFAKFRDWIDSLACPPEDAQKANVLNFLKSQNVIWAVNCGSFFTYANIFGIQYNKDNGYAENSNGVKYRPDHIGCGIKNSVEKKIHEYERHSEHDLTYDIAFNPDKTVVEYTLITKYSEIYFKNEGKRVFHLRIGNKVVEENIDIFQEVGHNADYTLYTRFIVKDNKVYHNGKECEQGYDVQKQQLKIVFEKGPKDNPKINAIILYKGDALKLKKITEGKLAEDDQKQIKEQVQEQVNEQTQQVIEEESQSQGQVKDLNNDFDEYSQIFQDHQNDFKEFKNREKELIDIVESLQDYQKDNIIELNDTETEFIKRTQLLQQLVSQMEQNIYLFHEQVQEERRILLHNIGQISKGQLSEQQDEVIDPKQAKKFNGQHAMIFLMFGIVIGVGIGIIAYKFKQKNNQVWD